MIDEKKIRRLRVALNVTQYKMANDIGVMPATLCEIESGRSKNPKISTLIGIADYLGVTVGDLILSNAPRQL